MSMGLRPTRHMSAQRIVMYRHVQCTCTFCCVYLIKYSPVVNQWIILGTIILVKLRPS